MRGTALTGGRISISGTATAVAKAKSLYYRDTQRILCRVYIDRGEKEKEK